LVGKLQASGGPTHPVPVFVVVVPPVTKILYFVT